MDADLEVKSKRRGAYHHGDLRKALVDATRVLIERGGPAGVSLRGAARLAGVSQTAPYRHFKDKRALLAALAEEGFRDFERWLAQAGAPHVDDPERRLCALGGAYVRFAVARPAHFQVMFGPELGDKQDLPSLLAAGEAAFGHLLRGVADCRARGLLRDEPIEDLALVAWSTVHGLATLILGGQLRALGLEEASLDELAERVSTSALLSLRAPGAAPAAKFSVLDD